MNEILTWISANQQTIYIVILMVFLGIEVIGRVPSVLHTPLMSGANAIHGVVIIGAIIVMGRAESDNYLALIPGFVYRLAQLLPQLTHKLNKDEKDINWRLSLRSRCGCCLLFE